MTDANFLSAGFEIDLKIDKMSLIDTATLTHVSSRTIIHREKLTMYRHIGNY